MAVMERLKHRSAVLQAIGTWPVRQWTRAISQTSPALHGGAWGYLPALSLVSALGLLLLAWAYTGARSGAGWAEAAFWAGLLITIVPIAVRLIAIEASRTERLGLLLWLGLALYLAKVMHSPYAFTFADELIHAGSANTILASQHLFADIPMLPAISFYPGLETATTALASLSGLSVFVSGLIVVGVARLLLVAAMFLLFEQVSRSTRVSGIATLVYTANANFMFWSAQFSYESLALPLGVLALYIVAQRETVTDHRQRRSLTAVAMLIVSAVVVTHHLTSYALVAFLWATVAVGRFRGNTVRSLDMALFTLAAVVVWLVSMASITIGYLSPVIGSAVTSTVQLITGEQASRELFRSASGYLAPLWERVTGIASVVIVVATLPFGVRRLWPTQSQRPFTLVLIAAAMAYGATLLMRLSPAAWEVGNRASEFLFMGVAYAAAVAVAEVWLPRDGNRRRQAAFAAGAAVVFMGGIIAGWPPSVRLPAPYVASTGAEAIQPQGVTAALWARDVLGPGHRMAADESNARLMLAYGDQYPLTGKKDGTKALIYAGQIGRGETEILQVTGVRFVVMDHRLKSWDTMAGLYFDRAGSDAAHANDLMNPDSYLKFDRDPSVSRVLDSGMITIYDVGALSHVP